MKTAKHCYTWSGITAQGEKTHGEIIAFSRNLAVNQLQQQGIHSYTLHKKRRPLWQKRITATDLVIFYRQLATLITAGVPLIATFSILLKASQHGLLKELIQALKTTVESGKTLTQAIAQHPRYIDSLTCHLIYLAEQTGTLEASLMRIANAKENVFLLKKKITQALIYPAILCSTALIITLTLLTVVMPRFANLFANFHAPLPAFTTTIISIAAYCRRNYWLATLPFFSGFLFSVCYHQSRFFKNLSDRFFLKLPGIGQLYQKIIFARLARTLATVYASGMPITEGLKLLTNITGNHAMMTAIQQLQTEIASGQRLYQAMQANCLFPPVLTQMVRIGEESAALEAMLGKAAEFYETEIDHAVNSFSHVLEPLIIIVLGVLIGSLVVAMYLPIFKLGTVI